MYRLSTCEPSETKIEPTRTKLYALPHSFTLTSRRSLCYRRSANA